MARRVIPNNAARSHIANRLEFRGSNFYGETHTPGYHASRGHLPEHFAETLDEADYIVSSYWTPIAWHLADGWVIPPVSFSVSTAKHQGYVRHAVWDDRSPRNIPAGWELGLTVTQSKALDTLRQYGNVGGYSRRTLQALVDAGLAVWDGPNNVRKED